MSYLTKADAKARIPRQWPTLYAVSGVVDETQIESDLAGAEAEVNGYLAKRYTVPVTVGLDLVKDWCLTLFEEKAYARGANPELPKKVSDRIAAVRRSLRDVADGRLSLGVDPAPAENTAGTGMIVVAGPDPEFTREKMKGF